MPQKLPYSASVRLRQRTNGTVAYDVRYRLAGSSRSTSFDTSDAAERWANIVRHIGPSEALALLSIETKHLPTVSQYAERYISSKSGVEGRTLDKYRSYMATSIGPAIGPLPIDAVTPARIAQWVNQQAEAGSAGKTIANRHGFLAAMFNHAVIEGLLPKSPCLGTRLPKTERQEMVFLSYTDFDELLAEIPDHYKPLVSLLVLTGMRFGEATALRPGDFDLGTNTVRVARAWKRSIDKGHYIGPPKTQKSRRTVSFSADLVPSIRPLVDPKGEFVFTNMTGGPVRQPTFFTNIWDPARRRAAERIGKSPRIHDLRHTHASWLLAAGVPLNVIQRRLGHESIKTTVDVYGHLAPDVLFAPAQALNGKLALTR